MVLILQAKLFFCVNLAGRKTYGQPMAYARSGFFD